MKFGNPRTGTRVGTCSGVSGTYSCDVHLTVSAEANIMNADPRSQVSPGAVSKSNSRVLARIENVDGDPTATSAEFGIKPKQSVYWIIERDNDSRVRSEFWVIDEDHLVLRAANVGDFFWFCEKYAHTTPPAAEAFPQYPPGHSSCYPDKWRYTDVPPMWAQCTSNGCCTSSQQPTSIALQAEIVRDSSKRK